MMNRQFIFFISAIIVGVILIGVTLISENTQVEKTEFSSEDLGTNFSNLEKKITVLKNQGYDPTQFVNIRAEIHSSFSQQLITAAGEQNLKLRLQETQSSILFTACESFLGGRTSNSDQLQEWLLDYKRTYPAEVQVGYYQNQIKAFMYYLEVLPENIDRFMEKKCYDEETISKYKNEYKSMPKLDEKYSNCRKLKDKAKAELKELIEYNSRAFQEFVPC